jgi:GNAT superfamily N-acetyltransferase
MTSKHDEPRAAQSAVALEQIQIKPWGAQPDYQAITDLLNASLRADRIENLASTAEMENYYEKLPEFYPNKDGFLAFVDDEPIAWASLQPRHETAGDLILRHYVALPEPWRGLGLRERFINLAEQRARERTADLPPDQVSWLEANFSQTQQRAIHQIEDKGYEPVRYFYFMVRSLADPIEDHPLPPGFYQRQLTQEDLRPIWQANQLGFSEHWGAAETSEEHYQMFLNDPMTNPDLWQIAWYEEQVAGMVLNMLDERENKALNRLRGYTEDIAVLKPYRRRGLAKALITNSMRMFKEMGMEETALGVDTENATGALQLYEDLGYVVERSSTAFRRRLT